MQLEDMPAAIQEALEVHEALLRLGFHPDRIWADYNPNPQYGSKSKVRVVLVYPDPDSDTNAEARFVIGISKSYDKPVGIFLVEWNLAVEFLSARSPEQRDEWWKTSNSLHNHTNLVNAILACGINIPSLDEIKRQFDGQEDNPQKEDEANSQQDVAEVVISPEASDDDREHGG